MHSGIRILCLLLFCTLLSHGGEQALPAALLLLLFMMLFTGIRHTATALPMLLRLKYFYLSLLILYPWFTPGHSLVPAWGDWSPSLEGLQQALARIAILVVIVLAVNLLLRTTPREHLLSGILWLLRPLSRIGLATEQLALRIVLVLQLLEHRPDPASRAAWPRTGSVLDQAAGRIALRCREAVAAAEAFVPGPVSPPAMVPAPLWQWLFPALMPALFLADRQMVF